MKSIWTGAVIALFSVSGFAEEITCKATYRMFDAQKTIEEQEVPLEVTMKGGGITKLEAELQNQAVYVSATLTDATGSVLLTIIKAPEYTSGILSRANMKDGLMRLAETQTLTETQVVCGEKKSEDGEWCKNPEIKEIKTGRYTLHKVECYAR